MTWSLSEQTAIRRAQNFWKVMFKERLSMAKFTLLIEEGQGQVSGKLPRQQTSSRCHYISFDLKGQRWSSTKQSLWVSQQLGGCSAFLPSPLLFTMQIYPLHPGLSGESNVDTRGLENEIVGRQDEKLCLFSEEERSHSSKC